MKNEIFILTLHLIFFWALLRFVFPFREEEDKEETLKKEKNKEEMWQQDNEEELERLLPSYEELFYKKKESCKNIKESLEKESPNYYFGCLFTGKKEETPVILEKDWTQPPEEIRRVYYPDGTLKWEVSFRKGKPNGPFFIYYKNGILKKTGFFCYGVYARVVKEFHRNGNLKRKKSYNAYPYKDGGIYTGILNGLWRRYDADGRIRVKTRYVEGRLSGEYLTFFKNGKVKRRSFYNKNGRKEGWEKRFYECGTLHSKVFYKNGVRMEKEYLYDLSGNLIE